MKYCLSSRQDIEFLRKADEIKVQARDYRQIYDLLDDYPEKTIICSFLITDDEKYWKELETIGKLALGRVIICLYDLNQIEICKKLGFKYYYGIPSKSFEELFYLRECGASYLFIDTPLTHMIDKVSRYGIPVRMIANRAYSSPIPHENGIVGGWVRPEEVETIYDKYIDVFEFITDNRKEEQTCYKLYAENKEWPGDLDLLIKDLGISKIKNRAITLEESQFRAFCGMKCVEGNRCRHCFKILKCSNSDFIGQYSEGIKKLIDSHKNI